MSRQTALSAKFQMRASGQTALTVKFQARTCFLTALTAEFQMRMSRQTILLGEFLKTLELAKADDGKRCLWKWRAGAVGLNRQDLRSELVGQKKMDSVVFCCLFLICL